MLFNAVCCYLIMLQIIQSVDLCCALWCFDRTLKYSLHFPNSRHIKTKLNITKYVWASGARNLSINYGVGGYAHCSGAPGLTLRCVCIVRLAIDRHVFCNYMCLIDTGLWHLNLSDCRYFNFCNNYCRLTFFLCYFIIIQHLLGALYYCHRAIFSLSTVYVP